MVCACGREDSRLTASMLLGANAFLLRNGCDVASRAADLHRCVRPLVARVRPAAPASEPTLRGQASMIGGLDRSTLEARTDQVGGL